MYSIFAKKIADKMIFQKAYLLYFVIIYTIFIMSLNIKLKIEVNLNISKMKWKHCFFTVFIQPATNPKNQHSFKFLVCVRKKNLKIGLGQIYI